MRYNWIFWLYTLLSFACLSPGTAQTPVQITNYNYKNYKGGIQNWGITVSPGQVLYSSNNNGLLRYNGNDWALLEPGERSTVRAVCCIGNRIYTAGDNNIGYWQYDANGKINYTSLLFLVNKLVIKGETFWSIAKTEGKVYFHSFGNIIWYDGKDMGYLVKNDCCVSLYPAGDKLFTQKCGGLFLIDLKNRQQTHYHSSQLQDLNIHGLCFADKNFLWLSLDNGISSIILEPATYLWKTNTDTAFSLGFRTEILLSVKG